MIRLLTLSICLPIAAFAQVGGPILGYVPEGESVRVLYGLPAAGAIGATIAEGGWSKIAISPAQNFLLSTAAATGEVLNVNLVKPSVTSITGVSANPDLIAVSPSGTAAALWFTSLGRMQVVTGLPGSPSVATMDAPYLDSTPTAIAVSDDGQWAAGVWSAGVYAFGISAKIMPLQTDPGVVSLAFFHANHNLAIATTARATSITDVGGANQASILYDYSKQALLPKGIGVSFDNQRVLVADAAGKLVNISVAASSAVIVDCGCSPNGVYGLGDALFRLNGTGRSGIARSGPTPELKLFDAAADSVWIVPPALVAAKGERQ
jgi:DNA-binding beta-propeller fold protein YncE